MMKKVINFIVMGVLFVLLFNFTSASAGLEQVRRINMSYFGLWYMHNGASGSFTLDDSSFQGGYIYTYGDTSTYTVQGTITYTPMLINDFSTASLAQGTFQGGSGVTVTLKGTIKEDGVTVYTPGEDDVLLQATVWGDSAKTQNQWNLIESSLSPHEYELTELYLGLENTGLVSGITLDNGDVLKIGETEMDLSMGDANGNPKFIPNPMPPVLFISDPTKATRIEFVAAIPEPATLILMAAGAVFLRKRTSR